MKEKVIFVAGHRGMVGSAICRHLNQKSNATLITKTRDELNLLNQLKVQQFFESHDIDEVYLAAAKVGGIHANSTYPAEFIHQNLVIQSNVIHSAFLGGVKRLLFLGSSCIYPKFASQPIKEKELLTGLLEPTNEPYAIAKIAGIKLCEAYNRQYGKSHGINYRSVMPTNLYGPGDNYHPDNSHVLPALIRKIHEAKEKTLPAISVWGTGSPMREFLHADDLAAACVFVQNLERIKYGEVTKSGLSHINVGSGEEIAIADLARTISEVVGYKGKIGFDISKPDGTPRKLMDSSVINQLGWTSSIPLRRGIELAYQDFKKIITNK